MAASASRAIYKSNARSETTLTAGTRAQGRARCSSTGCHIRMPDFDTGVYQRAQTELTPTAHPCTGPIQFPRVLFGTVAPHPAKPTLKVTLMPTARHSRSAPACWGPSLAHGQLTWQQLHKASTGSEQLDKDCSVRVQRVLPQEGLAQAPSLSPTCQTRSELSGLQLGT